MIRTRRIAHELEVALTELVANAWDAGASLVDLVILGQISDPEHKSSILIETEQVLNDLFCLIQKDDDRHFDQMEALVTK